MRSRRFSNFHCGFISAGLKCANPIMKKSEAFLFITIPIFCVVATTVFAAEIPAPRVEPKLVNPGPPPSDAIVLFDGKNLSQWTGKGGGEARWDIKDGVATVNGTGTISTKESFGDCQFHIEWASPIELKG